MQGMYLVTKYNKNTSDLWIIGLGSTLLKARELVSKDIILFQRDGFEVKFKNNKTTVTSVIDKVNLEYMLTYLNPDQQMTISEF